MEETKTISRRDFIVRTTAYTGGLIIAFHVPKVFRSELALAAAGAPQIEYPPNAFIRIAPDDSITLTINRLEMGQGVNTAFAQLIAEELGCRWEKIQAVASSADTIYNTPGMPFIITGGSMSVRTSWEQYRKIGAGMREMLETAAAKRWGVPVSSVRVEDGQVICDGKGRFKFGDLAEEASQIPFPEKPTLKSSKDYTIIGKSMRRLDADDKSNGKAIFGLDVRLPSMLYAMVAKPPLAGSKLVSFDESAARKISGVVDVVKFADRVAVLAKNSHAAHLGQAALNPQWDSGQNATASTEAFMQEFRETGPKKGILVEERGSVDQAMPKAHHELELEYEFPFLAHAPMEPMNCTIHFDGEKAEIYGGMQMPTGDRAAAAKTLGIPVEKVGMHITYAGGSFGRRANKVSDYVVEACELAKVVKKPLKVVWSREDDMRGGFYRPMNYHRVKLGLDHSKNLVAWDHHIVGQSLMEGSFLESMMVKNGVEDAVVEGVKDTPYSLKNFRLQQTRIHTPMTTLWWRSVGNTHTAYVMETAIDELAEQGGHDPLEFRRHLLKKSPKHMAVLDLLKKESGWGRARPPKDRAWGLAIHESFQSVVGHIAEVSIEKGFPRVHRVWSAAHVGHVVNPEGVATQIEGGVVFGISAILYQQIQLKDGKIVQGNFDNYPVLRMQEAPEVSVHLVKTDEHPTGIGEPGVPPIGPAVANAVYRLSGKRVRVLPFSKGMKA
jgi:isoquinoline 1-oxidoreductase beta subunit